MSRLCILRRFGHIFHQRTAFAPSLYICAIQFDTSKFVGKFTNIQPSRFASANHGRGGQRVVKEEEEEENEDEEEGELELESDGLDYKDRQMSISNARLDALARTAFGLSKSEIITQIGRGMFRINGEVEKTKGRQLMMGDVVDMYISPFPENQRLTVIKRCIIKRLTLAPSKVKFEVAARIYPNFVVDDF